MSLILRICLVILVVPVLSDAFSAQLVIPNLNLYAQSFAACHITIYYNHQIYLEPFSVQIELRTDGGHWRNWGKTTSGRLHKAIPLPSHYARHGEHCLAKLILIHSEKYGEQFYDRQRGDPIFYILFTFSCMTGDIAVRLGGYGEVDKRSNQIAFICHTFYSYIPVHGKLALKVTDTRLVLGFYTVRLTTCMTNPRKCRAEIEMLYSLFTGDVMLDIDFNHHFEISRDFLSNGSIRTGVKNAGFLSLRQKLSTSFTNPFRPDHSLEFDIQVVFLCLKQLDIWYPYEAMMLNSISIYMSPDSNTLMRTTSYRSGPLKIVKDVYFIPTGFRYLNFVSCDGVNQRFSLSFYLAPYDSTSWYLFSIITFLIIPLLPTLLLKVSMKAELKIITALNLIIDLILFGISAALELCGNLPQILKNDLRLYVAATGLTGSWVFLLVTLTNGYKGIVTSELTAAPTPKGKWTNVTDMLGFVFVASKLAEEDISFLLLSFPELVKESSYVPQRVFNIRACACLDFQESDFIQKYCQELGMYTVEWERGTQPCKDVRRQLDQVGVAVKAFGMDESQHCDRIRKRARAYRENETRALKSLDLQDYFAFHSLCKKSMAIGFDAKMEFKKSPLPFGGAVLSSTPRMEVNPNISTKEGQDAEFGQVLAQTNKCSKSAYLAEGSQLDEFLAWLQIKGGVVNYQKGKRPLLYSWTGVEIERLNWISNSFYSILLDLMAYGVYQVWDKWNHIVIILEKERQLEFSTRRNPEPLSMNSNLWTAFSIYFVFIAFGGSCFLLESRHTLLKNLKTATSYWLVNLRHCYRLYKSKSIFKRSHDFKS